MNQSESFVKGDDNQWQDIGGGLSRQIMGWDAELMMVRVRFPKGGVGTLHSHPHRQVSYVESGSFEVEIAGKKQLLRAGDSFYVPPNAEHGAVAQEDSVILDVFSPAREDFVQAT